MKVLKTAGTRNLILDESYYIKADIELLLKSGIAFFLKDRGNYCYEATSDVTEWEDEAIRINLGYCEEIKVIYDKLFDIYVNVVTLKPEYSKMLPQEMSHLRNQLIVRLN